MLITTVYLESDALYIERIGLSFHQGVIVASVGKCITKNIKGNKMLKRIYNYLFCIRTGTEIINEQIRMFKDMVDNLADGIDLIDEDIVTNQVEIHRLKAVNKELGDKKAEALTFKQGLSKLLKGE